MRIEVDRELCEGHARCVEVAPALFDVSDDDQVVLLDATPPETERALVEEAVRWCPRAAIALVDGP
jgi:ferredoxin